MRNPKTLGGILGLLTLFVVCVLLLDVPSIMTVSPPLMTDDVSDLPAVEPGKTTDTADDSTSCAGETEESTTETIQQVTAVPERDDALILTFLGDCSPGSPLGTSAFGSLNARAAEKGTSYFWENILPLLSEDDYTIAANTCILTDTDTDIENALCSGPVSNASFYSDGSIELVSFSTAEADPAMAVDWESTMTALTGNGVQCASDDTVTYLTKNGITVALLTTTLVKNIARTEQISAIEEADAQADYVIVYFRGGETNAHTPEEWLCSTLHNYADAGADLLIGHGTGVIRPVEQYGNSTIVYSLGSLIDGGSVATENITMLLRFTIQKSDNGTLSDTISYIPCLAYDEALWQPAVLTDKDDEEHFFRFLAGTVSSPIAEST